MIAAGTRLGRYEILAPLGAGGMGEVYCARDTRLDRKVAVKVLPTVRANNPAALGRFHREARAAGVLNHPNLVKCHDIDQEGELHYLVMDYVDGSSLQDVVTRFGPLSVPRACHYVRLAARATSSGPVFTTSSCRLAPSTYSMTRKCRPLSWSMSWHLTRLGCSRMPAARASR